MAIRREAVDHGSHGCLVAVSARFDVTGVKFRPFCASLWSTTAIGLFAFAVRKISRCSLWLVFFASPLPNELVTHLRFKGILASWTFTFSRREFSHFTLEKYRMQIRAWFRVSFLAQFAATYRVGVWRNAGRCRVESNKAAVLRNWSTARANVWDKFSGGIGWQLRQSSTFPYDIEIRAWIMIYIRQRQINYRESSVDTFSMENGLSRGILSILFRRYSERTTRGV